MIMTCAALADEALATDTAPRAQGKHLPLHRVRRDPGRPRRGRARSGPRPTAARHRTRPPALPAGTPPAMHCPPAPARRPRARRAGHRDGPGRFTLDLGDADSPPGPVLHMKLLRSPHAHASSGRSTPAPPARCPASSPCLPPRTRRRGCSPRRGTTTRTMTPTTRWSWTGWCASRASGSPRSSRTPP